MRASVMMSRVSTPPIAAAILAGGRARRFGGLDKSRLLVEGHPIIFRQVDVLQRVARTVCIISGDSGRFADIGVPVFADVIPDAGALGGVLTALESVEESRVIAVACDLPFLDAGLLSLLADRALEHDAAWVRTRRGPEPLIACYQRSARAVIRARIEAGHLRAGDLASVMNVADVSEEEVAQFGPPERLLANLNTREEYERIQYRDP